MRSVFVNYENKVFKMPRTEFIKYLKQVVYNGFTASFPYKFPESYDVEMVAINPVEITRLTVVNAKNLLEELGKKERRNQLWRYKELESYVAKQTTEDTARLLRIVLINLNAEQIKGAMSEALPQQTLDEIGEAFFNIDA